MNLKVTGLGAHLPGKVLTNRTLCDIVDTSEEWIESRTGIRERRISGDPTWKMGVLAAEAALRDAGIGADALDLVIAATATPDYLFPSLSCIIQDKIGAVNAFCFDLSAACTGFIYALDVVQSYFASGRAKRALVVSAETLSKITDYSDRSTCILFGDGAGAAVCEASEDGGFLASHLSADGSGGVHMSSRAFRTKNLFFAEEGGLFPEAEEASIHMNGRAVFKFAVRAMGDEVQAVCDAAGISPDALDVIIPHQANARIIKASLERYHFDPEKVIVITDKLGNTSSSSVPLGLVEARARGLVAPGKLVCLVGFGAGLTSGAALIRW